MHIHKDDNRRHTAVHQGKVEFKFDERVNVFVGPNASGKDHGD